MTRTQARELGFSDEVLTRMAMEIPDPRETIVALACARIDQPEVIEGEVSEDGRVLRGVGTHPAGALIGCHCLCEGANRFARMLAVTALPLIEQELLVFQAMLEEFESAAAERDREHGTAEERADRRALIAEQLRVIPSAARTPSLRERLSREAHELEVQDLIATRLAAEVTRVRELQTETRIRRMEADHRTRGRRLVECECSLPHPCTEDR